MYFVFVPVPVSIQLPVGSEVIPYEALPAEFRAQLAQQLQNMMNNVDVPGLAAAPTEQAQLQSQQPDEMSDQRQFLERCFDLPEEGN